MHTDQIAESAIKLATGSRLAAWLSASVLAASTNITVQQCSTFDYDALQSNDDAVCKVTMMVW
jgi:hypothetical protein